jgi:hypothetical protein
LARAKPSAQPYARSENRIKLRVHDLTEELELAGPVQGIRPRDRVRVGVREESGRRIAQRVEELSSRQ